MTRAESVVFYPSACLGGWNNPDHASGKPEGDQGKRDDDYTSDNSAVLSNISAQIFCGGFKGEIPPESEPKSIRVSFFWTLKAEEKFVQSSSSVSQIDSVSVSGPDSTTTPATQAITPSVSATPSSPIISSTTPDVPASLPDQQTPAAPVSFFNVIIPKVFADEDLSAASTSTALPESAGNYLEILYTSDGSSWQSLGQVSPSTLHGASFDLPISPTVAWDDLSKFQIQIRSLPTVDNPGAVYLDGMQLEVVYGPPVNQDKRAHEDPTKQHIINIEATSTPLQLKAGLDEVKNETLEILSNARALGGLDIYNTKTGAVVLSANPDQTSSYEVSVQYFDPGSYVVLRRDSSTSCNGLSLKACEDQPGFVDKNSFDVGAPSDSHIPVSTTTEPVI